jgi:hypothetical protein
VPKSATIDDLVFGEVAEGLNRRVPLAVTRPARPIVICSPEMPLCGLVCSPAKVPDMKRIRFKEELITGSLKEHQAIGARQSYAVNTGLPTRCLGVIPPESKGLHM